MLVVIARVFYKGILDGYIFYNENTHRKLYLNRYKSLVEVEKGNVPGMKSNREVVSLSYIDKQRTVRNLKSIKREEINTELDKRITLEELNRCRVIKIR